PGAHRTILLRQRDAADDGRARLHHPLHPRRRIRALPRNALRVAEELMDQARVDAAPPRQRGPPFSDPLSAGPMTASGGAQEHTTSRERLALDSRFRGNELSAG